MPGSPGKLVCFFSSIRSPDANNPNTNDNPKNNEKTSYTYTHPRSYDSWEQYRMISQLPRPITGDDDDSYDDPNNLLLPFHSYLKVLMVILVIVHLEFFFLITERFK